MSRAELIEFLIDSHMVSSIDAEDLSNALIEAGWVIVDG